MKADQAQHIINQQREVYNTIGKHFSDTRQHPWRDMMFIRSLAKPGDTVVDIGCGNGRVYQLFSDLSIRYIGIDQSETQLQMAKEKVPEGDFFLAEMSELPLEDAVADLVVCIAAFHHLPDTPHRLRALQEMKRIARPGAHIAMTNWNLESGWAKEKVTSGEWRKVENGESNFLVPWKTKEGEILGDRFYHGFSFPELELLVTEAGLSIADQYYVKDGERSDEKNSDNIVTIMVR